uniref:Uncharacterized protein n=1 Tax=Poecilia reticulata TaxID=8081 RepID=A0A3P9PGR3_POERE
MVLQRGRTVSRSSPSHPRNNPPPAEPNSCMPLRGTITKPPCCSMKPPCCSMKPPCCSMKPPCCSMKPPCCSMKPPCCSMKPPCCKPFGCSADPDLLNRSVFNLFRVRSFDLASETQQNHQNHQNRSINERKL